MKYILVTNDEKKMLERIFDVTRQTVYNALYYKSDSEISRKIRNVALTQYGGRIIRVMDVTNWQPNCETRFEHGQEGVKRVISTFSNDVRLVLDCHNDTAVITKGKEEIRRYWNVTSVGWGNVLLAAEQMAVTN